MDPLSSLSLFATIIGLIANFRTELGAGETASHRQFLDWLEHHRHEEIKNLITNTYHLQTELDQILRSDLDQILQAITQGNTLVAEALGRLESFAPLAMKLALDHIVSDQAMRFLRGLHQSGHQEIMMVFIPNGVQLHTVTNSTRGDYFRITEPFFVEEDLNTLVKLNLLRRGSFNKVSQRFVITRLAGQFLSALNQ